MTSLCSMKRGSNWIFSIPLACPILGRLSSATGQLISTPTNDDLLGRFDWFVKAEQQTVGATGSTTEAWRLDAMSDARHGRLDHIRPPSVSQSLRVRGDEAGTRAAPISSVRPSCCEAGDNVSVSSFCRSPHLVATLEGRRKRALTDTCYYGAAHQRWYHRETADRPADIPAGRPAAWPRVADRRRQGDKVGTSS